MAMLAERRTKTRYTLHHKALDFRGNAWCEDSSKFGQRMLEKMGWAPGKGLGANENGSTDPVSVSYKWDSKGMGYKGAGADEAVAQQKDFDALLATLTQGPSPTDEPPSKSENTPKSLELMSQKSRARVHYHKFTRGKDLSRASSKDLASILGLPLDGKKPAAEPTPIITPAVGPPIEQNVETTFGITTIARGNYNEYFKQKYNERKNKFGCPNSTDDTIQSEEINNRVVEITEEEQSSFVENRNECSNKPKKNKKKRKKNEDSCESEDNCNTSILNKSVPNDSEPSASKGRRKSVTWGDVEVSFVSKYIKDMVDTSSDSLNEDGNLTPLNPDGVDETEGDPAEVPETGGKKKKKKKKRKSDSCSIEEDTCVVSCNDQDLVKDETAADEETLTPSKKKKKKKDKKDKLETSVTATMPSIASEEEVILSSSGPNEKKKKKKKSKQESDDNVVNEDSNRESKTDTSIGSYLVHDDKSQNLETSSKKKKKNKKSGTPEENSSSLENGEHSHVTSIECKKRKLADVEREEVHLMETSEKPKKKKHKAEAMDLVEPMPNPDEIKEVDHLENEQKLSKKSKKKSKKEKHISEELKGDCGNEGVISLLSDNPAGFEGCNSQPTLSALTQERLSKWKERKKSKKVVEKSSSPKKVVDESSSSKGEAEESSSPSKKSKTANLEYDPNRPTQDYNHRRVLTALGYNVKSAKDKRISISMPETNFPGSNLDSIPGYGQAIKSC